MLIGMVLRHYLFFKKATIEQQLTTWLSRVFLGDILMGLSVLSFNFTPMITGIIEYADFETVHIGLKLGQTASIIFAGWANFGLYVYMRKKTK